MFYSKTFPPRNQAGFTLSELMVALAVASIIIVLVYQVFVSQQRVFTAQEDVAEAQQNARIAVDELTRTVSPLGTGAAVAEGQVRVLLAHPDQLIFNADLSTAHSALAAGTDLTTVAGYTVDDPYAAVPGSYASSDAETYRYYMRPDAGGVHQSLYREINLNTPGSEVALHLANQRVGRALFRYYGDFDGDGNYETLERVDQATSPLVAAGAPLDAVIRRIDLEIITETPFPDPRVATNNGYRQTVLKTSITPRNMWDCPIIQTASPNQSGLRAPTLRGSVTPLSFRVLRGALAEQGRTVLFTIDGPSGSAATITGQGTTDADGYVTTQVQWPNPGPPCAALPGGTYTVTATTSAPPSLDTPFGTCAPNSARTTLGVVDGLVTNVRFVADPLQLASCGDQVSVGYELLDDCGRLVDPADVDADQVWFVDTQLGGTLTPDRVPQGTPSDVVEYRSDTNAFAPGASRDPVAPHPFVTTLEARDGSANGPPIGNTAVVVHPLPDTLSGLTANLSGAGGSVLFSDCPSSTGVDRETFEIFDVCGNPIWTLNGSYLGNNYSVEARLESAYLGNLGGLTSTNNALVPLTPVTIRENTGVDGEFDVSYTPPTCGLGQFPRDMELVLAPSWDLGKLAGPVAFQVQPCTSCSVQVLDATGTPTTQLNRECEPQYDVVVTHCEDPGPATVELVLIPLAGATPSFNPTTFQDHILLSFDLTNPPGEAQQAVAQLYMGWADASSRFQIMAYLPDQASYTSGLLPSAVTCQSNPVDVDTSCEEILISDTPDNRGAFSSNSRPEDVTLCALEGSEVYFRVKDCDQNWRDFAADDLTNLAGSSRGILVEAVDRDTRAVLDIEEVDTLFEVDLNGVGRVNQPYFQGTLRVTQDPDDPMGNGLIRVPEGRVVELRATYRDPNDPTDTRCEAFALLVPPLPVCLPYPVASFGDWEGNLTVHGGDAVVAGELLLPATPRLLGKGEFDLVDRFFNGYVGGQIRVGGKPAGSTGPVGQPLNMYPNYFQWVPDTASLLTRLDYDMLKALARARRVYWEPDPRTGLLVNPLRADVGTGLPLTGTFQEVTQLPGPGATTARHPLRFLFIDAPAVLQSSTVIDAAATGALPRYEVTGDFYTEGLIYVAGSVDLGPVGGGKFVPIEFAATRDNRYNESDGGFTRADLPFNFDPTTGPDPVGNRAVNWNGVLYADGEIRLVDNPVVHGVVGAERGIFSSGSSEVWYDPQWMETRLDLCSECCGLSLGPASPTALLGRPLQLIANQPQGQVVWESMLPQMALVDDTGEVEPLQEGLATIRATDAAGCIAEVEVAVTCGLSLTSSAGTDLVPGDLSNLSASGSQGTVTWESSDPGILQLDRSGGVSVLGTALAIGGSQIIATDTVTTTAGPVQCMASLDFVINCDTGRTLLAVPENPLPGEMMTLAVEDSTGADVSAQYRFFADGITLAGQNYTMGGSRVSFTSELATGGCGLGPIAVEPDTCNGSILTATPNRVSIGNLVTFGVRDGAGVDVTAQYTFMAEPRLFVTIIGNTADFATTGDFTITGDNGQGCAVGPITVTVGPQ